MSLPNGSASDSDRTLSCPAWLALPHAYADTAYSRRGTGLHAFIARVIAGTPPADALNLVPEDDRATAACIDWHRLLGGLTAVRAEAAYALDVRAKTARFLGLNIGRGYQAAAAAQGAPLGPWEVPGSADIEGVDEAGLAVVADLKSGYGEVAPAEANGQGLFFAACRMLLEDRDECEFRIARLKASGAVYAGDRHTFTRWDVDEYLEAYAAALAAARDAEAAYAAGRAPDVYEGEWCRYCPGFNACHAKQALVRAAVPALADIDARIAAMTPEQAGAAYEVYARIKAALERVKRPLNERAHREGYLPLPGGEKVAKSISYPQARFSESLARGLIVQLGGTADQVARCYEQGTVTKVQVVNAPGVKRVRGPRKARALPAADAPMAEAGGSAAGSGPSVAAPEVDDESIPF